MTSTREAEIRDFLCQAGWSRAGAAPLAGDASNRRYLRLTDGTATAVLMDAPPDKGEDVRPFAAMTEWLVDRGLSAPRVLACDASAGLLLLEDLGDTLYARHLNGCPEAEVPLYDAAIRLLAFIAEATPPTTIGHGETRIKLLPYDAEVLARESALIMEWWVPAASDAPLPSAEHESFAALLAAATADVAEAREVVVLRDYHAENLIWLPERKGHARVGLLDYQDALVGHPAYDLVSLLEDARRDTSETLQQHMISLYLSERREIDHATFRAAYSALGAQRNLKIIGIFTRLAIRDGKPQYLSLIPRVWAHLQRNLTHHALSEVAEWVARHVPTPTESALAQVAKKAAQR